MPLLVCTRCCLEMRPIQIGVTVVEMAFDNPPAPYKTWAGDEKGCSQCGHTAVDGLVLNGEHHQEDFHSKLKWLLTNEPHKVRVAWERSGQSRSIEQSLIYLQRFYIERETL